MRSSLSKGTGVMNWVENVPIIVAQGQQNAMVKLLKTCAMKFFLDTAHLEEIKEAASFGILDGVTTNPALLLRKVLKTLRATCKPFANWFLGL